MAKVKTYYEEDYLDNVQYQENTAFAAVGAEADSDFEPYNLKNDSEIFQEAIGIQVSTYGDDSFLYDHWINSVCVRSLWYDPYEGWLSVQGKPEAWENQSFFKPGSLEQDLTWLEKNPMTSEQQHIAEVRHLISARCLIQGYRYPVITGEGVLFDIMQHFNLTYPRI